MAQVAADRRLIDGDTREIVRPGAPRFVASRWWLAIALGTAVCFCLTMVLYRARLSGTLGMRSMVWNLALACVPFPMAWFAEALTRRRGPGRTFAGVSCAALWLLFLPNSPYLVTDLIHLEQSWAALRWYDSLLYAAFAFTGVLIGYASLLLIQIAVQRRLGVIAGWVCALGCLGLSAFGVYLGRMERWNSWSVIDSPRTLARRILEPFRNPFANPWTIRYTVIFAAFLVVGYLTLAAIAFVMRELTPTRSR
jgi:uncharacterized membrane protein